MAKKIMLLPSVRSKYIKDNNMELIYKALIFLSIIMIISNYYMYSFMYAIKLILMIVVAVVATRETEILFYSHDKDITREESIELIKKSYPKITAFIYVLLIPVGTPLWLVMIGAIMATLFGKLLFGGFHHMVFHTSLVGVIFVTLGWNFDLGVTFINAFDNYLIQLLFDHNFFNNTLSIGGVFDPNNITTSLGMLENGAMYDLLDVMLGITPGVLASGIVLLGILIFLGAKKAVSLVVPITMIVSLLVTAFVIGIMQDRDMVFPIYHLFSGWFLFVVVFVATDPITTPVPISGKIIFGIIVGALTMIIRNGSAYEEGVLFAFLFMNMLTPMLNQELKEKKKTVKKPPVKEVIANE